MVSGIKFNDHESKRHQKSQNDRQIKNYHQTKEGVIVNSIVKDSVNYNQNDLLHDYIIPTNSKMPEALQDRPKKQNSSKSLKLLCGLALGTLGAIAGVTTAASLIAKKKIKSPKWEKLPDIGRSVNLNSEPEFVTYMTVQNPKVKNVIGAAAFFTFAATGFVLKNFVDGFKDTWVKKQEAKLDYKLQESLINVETKIFKGKNEIIRSMMQDNAVKMKKIIDDKDKDQTFEGFLNFGNKTTPKETKEEKNKDKKTNTNNILIGVGTLAAAVGLGIFSFKNIQKTGKLIEKQNDDMHKQVKEILDKTPSEIMEKHKAKIKDLFSILRFTPKETEEKLKKAKVPEKEVTEIVDEVKKRTNIFCESPKEVGGFVGKVQYSSYVDDSRGHFYNWMMNLNSKPLGILALAMTGVGAAGYVGQKVVEGIREVEVKKVNNQTELNFHKNLINVELRNFKMKKEAFVKPLLNEFKQQSPKKDKQELHDMAENILYEVKNGPPFVYS